MIKRFILNLKFVQKEIELQKKFIEESTIRTAFKNATKDLQEEMKANTEKQAEELAQKKLNDLLSIVDMNKIVSFDKNKGIIFIGGVKADEARLSNLKSEAEFFLESELWHLIYETPKELASRAMFVNGETLADMQKGKSILYTLSAQNNIVSTLKSYIGAQKPPAQASVRP